MGYQSDTETNDLKIVNFPLNHVLLVRQMSDEITTVVNNENYMTINRNLVIPVDLKIRRKDGVGTLNNALIKLPKPTLTRSKLDGITWTNKGKPITYEMGENGIMEFKGEITEADEEIIVNFPPYVAIFPLEYDETVTF